MSTSSILDNIFNDTSINKLINANIPLYIGCYLKNPQLTIILPAYNEADIIENSILIISNILKKSNIEGEILVVVDNSPDNTQHKVIPILEESRNVSLLVRYVDKGLSKSILDGIKYAKSNYILVTDADLQHEVELIPYFLNALNENYDVVIGSRYCKNGKIQSWGIKRRIISIGATCLGRILYPDITDPVSGFFAIKKDVIKNVKLNVRGYKILMDILGKGKYTTIIEIPYIFTNRKTGKSKLNMGIICDYLNQVYDLCSYTLIKRKGIIWNEWKNIFNFGLVGLSGVAVNYGIYLILRLFFNFDILLAMIIAIETSIITNFILNHKYTFKTHNNDVSFLSKFINFQFISMFSMFIQMISLFIFVNVLKYSDIYVYPFGIIIAFIFNYLLNRHITWKK